METRRGVGVECNDSRRSIRLGVRCLPAAGDPGLRPQLPTRVTDCGDGGQVNRWVRSPVQQRHMAQSGKQGRDVVLKPEQAGEGRQQRLGFSVCPQGSPVTERATKPKPCSWAPGRVGSGAGRGGPCL